MNSINRVIVGGESGPSARSMKYEWARSLGDQCRAAGVPYFFKQGSEDSVHWPYFRNLDLPTRLADTRVS